MNSNKLPRSKPLSGFSLIELIIVVALIAIIAAIAIPFYQRYTIHSQVTTGLHDISTGKSAFESLVVARNLVTFDVTDIGLRTSTTRCETISMEPGASGYIRCTISGHPQIAGSNITLQRNSSSQNWDCVVNVDARYLPEGCTTP